MHLRNFRIHIKYIAKFVGLVSLAFYFSYHFFEGDYGLLSWQKLDKHFKKSRKHLDDLKKQQFFLQKKVKLLHPSSLSAEYIEQIAKRDLAYSHPNEVVLLKKYLNLKN